MFVDVFATQIGLVGFFLFKKLKNFLEKTRFIHQSIIDVQPVLGYIEIFNAVLDKLWRKDVIS
jgi:hypothetical protein